MRKVLVFLLLAAILMMSVAFAIESNIYTFYRQASSTMAWTASTTATSSVVSTSGTPVRVGAHMNYTCQANVVSTTALSVKVLGSLYVAPKWSASSSVTNTPYYVREPMATNTPIKEHDCDAGDLVNSKSCIFSITSGTPVNYMRMDVPALAGTTTPTVNRINCLGL